MEKRKPLVLLVGVEIHYGEQYEDYFKIQE